MARKPSHKMPDEAAIRAIASPESFERGRDYRRDGTVSDLVLRGEEVSAAVAGSDVAPYRVTVRIADGHIRETRCTCPYEWGGACKHVVATLLTLVEAPEAAAERPALHALLEPLDRDALVGLILRRVALDPEMAGWVEAEVATTPRSGGGAPVDPRPVAARVRAVLTGRYRREDYWDGYAASGNSAELRALVERAVPFLEAGDGRNALRILEAVAEPLVDGWLDQGYAEDEEMYRLFHDLGRMMAEAALTSDLTEAERADRAATLAEWDESLAEYGVEEGFGIAVRALETGWDDPALAAILDGGTGPWPPEEADDLEDLELTDVRLRVLDGFGRHDAYLNLARAAGAHTRVATMLVRLGRIGEAVAHADTQFTQPAESLVLAEALSEAGRTKEALAIAEAGLRLGEAPSNDSWSLGRNVVPLARWLREAAGGRGRADLALTAARTTFEHTCALEDFQAARTCAGKGWPAVREDLIAHLIAAKHAHDRAEILLGEGMIDAAVACVRKGAAHETDDSVLLRLMEAAHASHPDWVIRLGESRAEAIMQAGSAGQYARAAEWLTPVAAAYDAAGRIDAWSTRIEGLIETHRRKYKLRPLLEALRY